MVSEGLVVRNPLRERVAAVSVGLVGGQVFLDLDYPEDSGAQVDMNVVGTQSGGLVEVQGTAEGDPFPRSDLDALLDLATSGLETLFAAQAQALQGD
jgi:ribonuclease PH